MSLFSLVSRNIRNNLLRSLLAFLCVMGAAAFFMSTMVISSGTQNSMQKGLQRLGADILVVPDGAQTDIETALLMGKPSNIWMPASYLNTISSMDGVAAASPQIYLQSLYEASCCSVSETFLVVFDPATDFTITPWLQQNLGRPLADGEVIGGSDVFSPSGNGTIELYGTTLKLVGNLQPTGTGMDQTIFFTDATAQEIAAASVTKAVSPLQIPPNEISAILVKLDPGVDVNTVTAQIYLQIPNVVPIPSPQLFGSFRQQMLGLLAVIIVFVALAWIMSVALIALVFSMSANERQRQMAVLRALGATRRYVLKTLLTEGLLLAAAAAVFGSVIGTLGIFIYQDYFSGHIQLPFLFPSIASLLVIFVLIVVLSLITVTVAIIFPAIRISRMEPAMGMRE